MLFNTQRFYTLMTMLFALFAVSLLGFAGCAAEGGMDGGKSKKMGKNMAHVHIGHVLTGWGDTPGGGGLLPTAIAEANIASQHAGFAAKQPGNLSWMKMHTRHVLHALDTSVEGKGPGKGYGMIKGAAGAAKHIGFAAKSAGASKNVKAHTVHVTASINNSVARAKEIVNIGKQVLAAGSASEAAPLVAKIKTIATQLMAGRDANGDGKITWEPGEGGLAEAAKHMGFMTKGEGM